MPEINNELMDMIMADESPSQISDKIKDILFAKSAKRVDDFRPDTANSLFGDQESADEVDAEVAAAAAVVNGDDPTAAEYNAASEGEVDAEADTEDSSDD